MACNFTIPVGANISGHYVYEFEIDKAFFDLFEESEIKEGKLKAIVNVDRESSHTEISIMITGEVRISCDRCLDEFDHPVDCSNRLIVRYGFERDESDPDIITLSWEENELDLKQYFYEFIHLSLPIRRTHPDDANGNSTCNPVMLEKLRKHLVHDEAGLNPGWEGLRKLMNEN
ncbi:MAG TPA: DUF177 domain-containing protein [Bacteroidales bacterium]|nr:DUF177 domain-containing protein [Bacteroidales bacterium]HNY52489.1 DUF177 domain-containing protein [Bacteroidales bacterium]HOG56731.1 DUF177 domain-containing protein [Bacteroidales bacterium]HPX43918.1 DUF177 domain-containing protein [Bacteroidales bacterium]HQB86352.1 DUF177 domain-containing protein [Bacteroidales bacterium]